MSPTLSNTQKGNLSKVTTDGTITKGHLVALKAAVGPAIVVTPTADGQRCDFLAIEDAYNDDSALQTGGGFGNGSYLVNCLPLTTAQNIRIFSGSTISGGTVVMAEATTGNIKAISGSGVYSVGILEEDVVSGQLGLVRPQVFST